MLASGGTRCNLTTSLDVRAAAQRWLVDSGRTTLVLRQATEDSKDKKDAKATKGGPK